MSTPLLDSSRFANLKRSLTHHATSDLSARSASMLNGELCRALGVHPFQADAKETVVNQIAAVVFDWQRANYNAHVVRYCDDPRPKAPTGRYGKGELLSPPATLKALRALRYNCDGGKAIGDAINVSLGTLDSLITALMDYCLDQHCPEYAAAEWAI